MNVPICTMRVTTTSTHITASGIPVLTTSGILLGIMAVTMVAAIMVVVIMAVTMVVVTMVMTAMTAVAVITFAESDLGPGDGEFPTADVIPDLGTGEGPDWKGIDPADESLIGEAGETGAI